MASIRKRGDRWQVQVKVGGRRKSKTFATKAAAVAWVRETEIELEDAIAGKIPNKTFGDLLRRYSMEVTPTKRGAAREQKFINRFLGNKALADLSLRELAPRHIAAWRDARLREVSGSTVCREMNILSHACRVAAREWGWLRESPVSLVSRPKASPPRHRRPAEDEIEALRIASGYSDNVPPVERQQRVIAAFLFAIETGMRCGEIAGLRRCDVHERHVHLPVTKNGTARDVPLSSRARALLDHVMEATDPPDVFGLTRQSIDALFRKMRDRAGIVDLHFHDSRHEAATRLSKKLGVMELARMLGIRDLKILSQVYYNPTIDELADRLD